MALAGMGGLATGTLSSWRDSPRPECGGGDSLSSRRLSAYFQVRTGSGGEDAAPGSASRSLRGASAVRHR